jgi:hypothetical protein
MLKEAGETVYRLGEVKPSSGEPTCVLTGVNQ